MTTTKITVTGCYGCPFRTEGEYDVWCQLNVFYGEQSGVHNNKIPKHITDMFHVGELSPSPSWCPLKNNNMVVVEMKTENNKD